MELRRRLGVTVAPPLGTSSPKVGVGGRVDDGVSAMGEQWLIARGDLGR